MQLTDEDPYVKLLFASNLPVQNGSHSYSEVTAYYEIRTLYKAHGMFNSKPTLSPLIQCISASVGSLNSGPLHLQYALASW